MKRIAFSVAALAVIAATFAISSPEQTPLTPATASGLDGTWELVAVVDDGKLIPSETAKATLMKDGKMVISGSFAKLTRPDGADRTLPFVVNDQVSPKTLDFAGTEKVGTHGIYMLDGDNLVICLKETNATGRPTGFSAAEGSGAVLLTFRRAGPAVKFEAPAPVAAKPALAEPDMRSMLVGRWGHQNDNEIKYITVNADGTFSSLTKWKKGFKKIFENEDRASGTWKLENGVIVYKFTASTIKGQIGQIHSLRIVQVSSSEVTYTDIESGTRRIEWKLPQ